MIFTAGTAFIKGDRDGLICGFFCGLLVDIFFGTYIGFFALIYMYIGFIVGKFHEIFFSQNLAIPIVFITIADFLFGFICYVLMFLFRTKFDLGYYMMNVIIPETVYTALIAIFYYPLILSVNQKIDDREERDAKKFV
jgi:rod shape-determining protein MreD